MEAAASSVLLQHIAQNKVAKIDVKGEVDEALLFDGKAALQLNRKQQQPHEPQERPLHATSAAAAAAATATAKTTAATASTSSHPTQTAANAAAGKYSSSRIRKEEPLVSPALLAHQIPCTSAIAGYIAGKRKAVADVICGRDDRLVVVVGPCSIHDVGAAKEYATRLTKLASELHSDLVVVMRTYFEKPRTTVGWKGLVNDPNLDGTFDINRGLQIARQLLLDVNTMGLPCAIEFLDTLSPKYIADLITWGAVGARTTESQLHRELVSGLDCPVGFKNSTDGSVKVAIDAMRASGSGHSFLGMNDHGVATIVHTGGNADLHVIHRGGNKGPNYSKEHIDASAATMKAIGVPPRIMVDCSHGNSQKKHENQLIAAASVAKQVGGGSHAIVGVMIESNINAGNQKLEVGKPLRYGVSVTDACIHWADTVTTLRALAAAVQQRRAGVANA